MTASNTDKALFDEHYPSLCYFVWRMIKDKSLAEDLVQDAFVSYFQRKDQVSDDPKAIKAYLYSTVRFAAYNLSRKEKVVRKFWARSQFNEIDDLDYEHLIIEAEFMQSINETLAKLPKACQQIMKMSYIDGLSNEQIAQELVLSVNTIKTQKRRGLNVLRAKVGPYRLLLIGLAFLAEF